LSILTSCLFELPLAWKPKGLGVATRKDMAGEEYLGLKPCGAGEYLTLHGFNFCFYHNVTFSSNIQHQIAFVPPTQP
jgi:hypothetical protein